MDLIEDLSQYRDSPAASPRALVRKIVEKIDPAYAEVGVVDIGGEGAIIRAKTSAGEDVCFKIALPNITKSFEDLHVWNVLRFNREKRNTYAERFEEGAKLQRLLAKLLTKENIGFFSVPLVYKIAREPFLYYEMEWIESVNIIRWLKEKKSLRYSLKMFRVLLRAIKYCHERAIIHRDIKSDNIMIGYHDSIVLVDWTLAKCVDDSERNLTVAGVPLGTFPYAPPKQLIYRLAKDATYIDDLHALGYCLWEFYRSQKAPRVSKGKEFDEIEHRKYRKQLAESIDEPFRKVFLKATDPNEASRYQLIEDFEMDLEDAILKAGLFEDDPSNTVPESDEARLQRYLEAQCAACTDKFCMGTGICRKIVFEVYKALKFLGDKA